MGTDTAKRPDRVPSVDLLRGLVMILMTLDHVRDYFSDGLYFDPADPAVTTPGIFVTRWVTHFCASTFVFLAGLGAALAEDRGLSKPRLAWFLVTRGLWLVVLELTLVRLGFFFSFDFHFIVGAVIWVLGWSMVILAGLQFLPRAAVAVFGVALIAGHNAFDRVTPAELGPWGWVWNILHAFPERPPYGVPLGYGYELFTPYKIIPWAGVMAAGYALGPIFRLPKGQRRRALLVMGLLVTAAFVALRWSNLYGDPQPWSPQPRGEVFTVCSFLNCNKYPPSLCYLLMTLGPALVALAAFDRPPGPMARQVITIGRVPLFFYLLHLPLIHGLAVLTSWLQTGAVAPWLVSPPERAQAPPGYGYNLAVVYAVWAGVVLLLYPLCVWFAGVKRRDRRGWLSYL